METEIFKTLNKEFLVVRFTIQHYNYINLYETGKYIPTITDEKGIKYLQSNPDTGILILEESEADEFFRQPLLIELAKFRKANNLNNHSYIFYQGTGQEVYMDGYLPRIPKWITFIQSHTAPYNLINNWSKTYSDNHTTLPENINNYKTETTLNNVTLRKKFNIYAGKPRVPRLMVLDMLIRNDYLVNSYYSFGKEYIKRFEKYMTEEQFKDILAQSGFENYKGKLEIDFLTNRTPTLTKKETKYYTELGKMLPVKNLPRKENDDYYYDDYFILPDPILYRSIFLDLVLETFNHRGCVKEPIYHNINFFTEKIFKPTLASRPFMVLANKGYLRDLKRLFGFKSFEYYWDESYDEKDDIRDAIKIIESNMRRLNNLPLGKLTKMLQDMRGILEHNNRTAYKFLTQGEAWKKVMKDYCAGKGVSWTGTQNFSSI